MTYSYNAASSEFATLCNSQIKLLTQGLGAIWSAIYLTKEVTESQEKKLFLFTVYPQARNQLPPQITDIELGDLLDKMQTQPQIASLSSAESNQEQELGMLALPEEHLLTKQLILPLIHEEVMMGLLITEREDRYWKGQELEQIKSIGQTLAIACFLERQSQWYRKQLQLQQEIRLWEQEQLGNLLHQLRNPLTALRTFSKLLLKRLLPEDRNHSVATNILNESDRLSQLIDQFAVKVDNNTAHNLPPASSGTSASLADTKSVTQNFLLPGNLTNLDSLNLSSFLEPLLNTARVIAESKGIKLITDLPPNFPLVKGNSSALKEVFNNLLDNAIKYTPAQGQITVRAKVENNLGVITIEDTGYGISEQDREHLFERYYRGIQAQGDIPGTGLGLAIAKQLIEQMQGYIEVISPNNISNDSDFPGTIFIVWLSIAND